MEEISAEDIEDFGKQLQELEDEGVIVRPKDDTTKTEDKMNDVTDEDSPDEFNRLSDEETNQLAD